MCVNFWVFQILVTISELLCNEADRPAQRVISRIWRIKLSGRNDSFTRTENQNPVLHSRLHRNCIDIAARASISVCQCVCVCVCVCVCGGDVDQ